MDKLNSIIESYPPELKLVLVCCGSERWKADEMVPFVNWDIFLKWVKRHRVTPAVFNYSSKNRNAFPEAIINKIDLLYRKVTQKNLLLASETVKICHFIESKGISAVPFKGVVLSYQLYGNINQREVRDIDLLVDQESLSNVIVLLKECGYIPDNNINAESLKIKSTFYPVVLRNKELSVTIELHRRLLPWNGTGTELQSYFHNSSMFFETGNIKIKIPTLDQHSIFCILHGMKHMWSGLQWLNDWPELKLNVNTIPNELKHIFHLSEAFHLLLYKEYLNNPTEQLKDTDWILHCIKSVATGNEIKLKTLKYKYLYFKLAIWINKEIRSFRKGYYREFFQRYFC